MSTITHAEPVIARQARTEMWFRRLLWLCCAIAALGLLGHLGMLLWAQNEFSAPESIVATHSLMLAQRGTLYYDLNQYPYTISAYTPLFYLLEAGLHKLGLATVLAGRMLSFAALLGLIALSWQLLMLYTRDRYCAWLAAILTGSTALFLTWGTTGQVD